MLVLMNFDFQIKKKKDLKDGKTRLVKVSRNELSHTTTCLDVLSENVANV